MIRVRCPRCGAVLGRIVPLPGLRHEYTRCRDCHHWPLVFVDGAGTIHRLALRTRQGMEEASEALSEVLGTPLDMTDGQAYTRHS